MSSLLPIIDQSNLGSKLGMGAGRVDTVFEAGERVLLRTKELLNAPILVGCC